MTYRAMLVIGLAILMLGALEDRSRSVSSLLFGRTLAGPPPREEPIDISSSAEAYDALDALLSKHVTPDGMVDYRKLSESEVLGHLIRWFGSYGPITTPSLFTTEREALAYYLNAYNTLVLWGVVNNWPLESVMDVPDTGLLSVKPGQGFFVSLRFVLDGSWINLYDLENTIIRGFGDARIHAAINCASLSCPKLQQTSFRADSLDRTLTAATEDMIATLDHVEIMEEEELILASPIFDWFREDFEGDGETLIGFWENYARGNTARALAKARESNYQVRFVSYDWQINAQ